MVPLSLQEIAHLTGGRVEGDASVVVTAPAVIDGREAAPGGLFAAFVGERTDGHDHVPQAAAGGAVAVLGSRPTELPTVVVEDVQDALQRLASHVVAEVRRSGGLTVVAVTGSQGKTSTKDLMAAVLADAGPTVATSGSFNNELGMPLTALRCEAGTRFLVLEMGARGIGHIAQLTGIVAPDVSVVLNVGTAHLEGFGSRDGIAQAKGELVEALRPGGTAVLNADDHRVAAMALRTGERVRTFGTGADADVRLTDVQLDRLGRPSFTLHADGSSAEVRLALVGAHQALNAAAAAGAALAAGLDLATVGQSLSTVTSLSKWRMELHELDSGVILLNDAYNANPESVRAALDALATIGTDAAVRRTVAVLGEMRELGADSETAHRETGAYAAEHADVVVAVGDAARGIADGAGERAVAVADNSAAVAWLRGELREGDAVLVKASNGARLYEVAAALL